MAASSAHQVGRPPERIFPFTKLPPELRVMIYREAFASASACVSFNTPTTSDDVVVRGYKYYMGKPEPTDSDFAADPESAEDKQSCHKEKIYTEAIDTCYNVRFIKLRIGGTFVDIEGVISDEPDRYLLTPEWLPKLRNVKIAFDDWKTS
ncbi:MAG: hypothetical protein Q9181_006631 [Wetmoreana brouardii]